ncbi:MAG: hypothetical protein AB7O49_02975 [Sphingomonadales bacterium]
MIVSNHQAASKWCPMARPDKDGRGINRTPGGEPLPGSSCLGTGCMLWVEHEYEHGYCGLARVPRV